MFLRICFLVNVILTNPSTFTLVLTVVISSESVTVLLVAIGSAQRQYRAITS